MQIGSTKEESVLQEIKRKIDKKLIDRILICSDGYYGSSQMCPHTVVEFNFDYIRQRLNEKLLKGVRDDLSYMLLEVNVFFTSLFFMKINILAFRL